MSSAWSLCAVSWPFRLVRWPMPTPSRAVALLATLWVMAPAVGSAASAPAPDPNDSRTAALVHDLWRFVSDVSTLGHTTAQRQAPSPAPQPSAPAEDGSPPVDLSDLSKPSEVEARLATAY